MKFDIVTIFPNIFDSYLNESILKRAQHKKIIKVKTHNIRAATKDKHKQVDDKPYGGGAGMVLMAEPILKTVKKIKPKLKKRKIIVFSAKGKQFTQAKAQSLAKQDQLILICGRYEGIDERVRKALKAEEVSIGPYVLTDGEVAAMAIISTITRLLPSAITKESLDEESFSQRSNDSKLLASNVQMSSEYPHYTRPEKIKFQSKTYSVPKVLLSGNHNEIKQWRERHSRKS